MRIKQQIRHVTGLPRKIYNVSSLTSIIFVTTYVSSCILLSMPGIFSRLDYEWEKNCESTKGCSFGGGFNTPSQEQTTSNETAIDCDGSDRCCNSYHTQLKFFETARGVTAKNITAEDKLESIFQTGAYMIAGFVGMSFVMQAVEKTWMHLHKKKVQKTRNDAERQIYWNVITHNLMRIKTIEFEKTKIHTVFKSVQCCLLFGSIISLIICVIWKAHKHLTGPSCPLYVYMYVFTIYTICVSVMRIISIIWSKSARAIEVGSAAFMLGAGMMTGIMHCLLTNV